MALKISRPSTATIFAKYRGPWTVMLCEYLPHVDKYRCRMSKLKFVRGVDVDTYCKQQVLEEEHVLSASVFDNRAGHWITTYTKKELEHIQTEELAQEATHGRTKNKTR